MKNCTCKGTGRQRVYNGKTNFTIPCTTCKGLGKLPVRLETGNLQSPLANVRVFEEGTQVG